MTATLICHAALSDTNSIEQLWSEISELVSNGEQRGIHRGARWLSLEETTAVSNSQILLRQNEMDGMFGFKCIFNGTASSYLSEFCSKVRAKKGGGEGKKRGRKKKKKHLIRRLGIGSGKELHAILDQSCCVYFLKEGPLIINSDLFLRAYTV